MDENRDQQQNHPTYDAETGNRSRLESEKRY